MQFNYTDTYNKVYSILKNDFLSHEIIHFNALKITNAMCDIYLQSKASSDKIATGISELVKDFSDSLKLGGYDLDDKGNPR